MDSQPDELLLTTVITQAEVLAGIAIMADGHRRRALAAAAEAIFEEDFDGRILPFDGDAVADYAEIFAMRRRAGRQIAIQDLMIAAIARAHGASIVTRDTGGFEGCGPALINPWDAV